MNVTRWAIGEAPLVKLEQRDSTPLSVASRTMTVLVEDQGISAPILGTNEPGGPRGILTRRS
jgi:hypothetical protein